MTCRIPNPPLLSTQYINCEYVPFDSYTGYLTLGVSALGGAICLAWTAWFHWHRRKPLIKAAQPVFLITLGLSAFIMCASAVLLLGEVTILSCQLKVWVPNLAFTTLFGCLLTKLYRVYQLFASKQAQALSKQRISARDASRFLFGFLTINICILLSWSVSDMYEPMPTKVNVPQYNGDALYVQECGNEGKRNVFPYLMAASHVFLVFISLYYATKCREVSKKFAEKKEVTISIYQSALLAILTGIVVAPHGVPIETKVTVLTLAIFFGSVGCVTIFAYPKWKNGIDTAITTNDLMLRSQRALTNASGTPHLANKTSSSHTPHYLPSRSPLGSTNSSSGLKNEHRLSVSTNVELVRIGPGSPRKKKRRAGSTNSVRSIPEFDQV